jgi:hypothetical protein
MKIRVVFTVLSLILAIRTLDIIIANPTILKDQVIINAIHAKGKVKYTVEKLPKGVGLT